MYRLTGTRTRRTNQPWSPVVPTLLLPTPNNISPELLSFCEGIPQPNPSMRLHIIIILCMLGEYQTDSKRVY